MAASPSQSQPQTLPIRDAVSETAAPALMPSTTKPPPLPPRQPSATSAPTPELVLAPHIETILHQIYDSQKAAATATVKASNTASISTATTSVTNNPNDLLLPSKYPTFASFRSQFTTTTTTTATSQTQTPTSLASAISPPANHDLTYPMSNYYISSSHNTYLSGNQLYGAATGDAYRHVLLRGCRCLEIDVWNGETDSSDSSGGDDRSSVSSPSSSDVEDEGRRGSGVKGLMKSKTRDSDKDVGSTGEHANSRLARLAQKAKEKTHRFRSRDQGTAPSGIALDPHSQPEPGMQSDSQLRPQPEHGEIDPGPDIKIDIAQLPSNENDLADDANVNPIASTSGAVVGPASLSHEKPSAREHRVPGVYRAEPIVKHGYTLTKKVPFRTVCHAILDSAFTISDLPVIVSLEVHASLEQQEIMVEILEHVFRDHLVKIPPSEQNDVRNLPSPDDLRRNILIKVKWSPKTDTSEQIDPREHIQSASLDRTVSGQSSSSEQKKKASKILHALSMLGVYTRAYRFKAFDQAEARIPTHIFSLSEAKVEDMHSDPHHGPALFEHNRQFLMRVFPSGLRVDSSNVEPCFLWRQGAQMVALNWQKLDRGMMLNEGMFADEEGWVLKPKGFRSAPAGLASTTTAVTPSGTVMAVVPQRQLLDLEIEVIAAQNLPPPLDKDYKERDKLKPYVKLQLHVDTHGPPGQGSDAGSTDASHAHAKSRYALHLHRPKSDQIQQDRDDNNDEEERRLKRKTRHGRSADPDFGGDVVRWNNIHDVVDELSFLRIKIVDDHAIGSDPLIAWTCVKLSRLRQGYRLLHLRDAIGRPCRGVLLVRIQKSLREV